MIYIFTRCLAFLLIKILFRFRVYGAENVYKVKGAVFAVNHSSFLDPVLAGTAFLRPVYFLARKSLFRYKFFGAYIRRLKTIPFNRDVPDTKALRRLFSLLKKGRLVLVFPEGTRSCDGALLPPHPGIGMIALKAMVPVIPGYIKGASKILPRNAKVPRLRRASLHIGEPVYPGKWIGRKKCEKSDYAELAQLVMRRIKELSLSAHT